jgi:4-diphosphocytidyl-2-C-methyl-D-erythritol kinase
MTLELIAPAKLNLALEVTARRMDGYHELVTVMQTIDLADRVRLDEASSIELQLAGEEIQGVPREGPQNLAYAAAAALAHATGNEDLGVRIELEKVIPAGMGLGGGSTDAAAVLRGLNHLWGLGFSPEELREVAAGVGSDVPFFLHGGTALVTGRGEFVEALPDLDGLDLTLFLFNPGIEDKTRRMYATLNPADYTDGHRARVLAESVRRGIPLAETDFVNVFDPHIGEVAPPLAGAMALCRDAGLAVFASGSGPGFFSPTPIDALPPLLLRELSTDWGVRAVSCQGLSREAALAMRET